MGIKQICKKCGNDKEIEEFTKCSSYKNGYRNICKECRKIYRDKKTEYESYKKWADKNREHLNEKARVLRASKPKKIRNKQSAEDRRLKQNEWYRNKIKTDPIYRLRNNIKRKINSSLTRKNLIKNTNTQNILGCSYLEFKMYIESLWKPWMNWCNYGIYNGEPNYGWDIDHIIEVSNGQTIDEIYKLNHYTNLQPLCSYENRVVKQKLQYS